jgi:hypothetical protein
MPEPTLMPHEEPLPPRTDLWVAAAFLLFGLVIFALALQMPTYREQRGEIYTAPGLVPALYGVVIALLSIWLGFRSIQRGALAGGFPSAQREGYSNARLALAAGLGLVFTGVLIGRMPFWIAAAIFVTLFIAIFEWQRGLDVRVRLSLILSAALQGVATGLIVMLVFQRVFLVRLP